MKQQIVSRWDSSKVIFECEVPDTIESGLAMRHALEQAVAARADLRSADLRSANLRSANLGGANLRSANLRSADLRSANLRSANLGGANLRSADLRSADLRSANLRSANLRSADLRSANLRSANLGGADLRSADLRSADLGGADLRSADLGGANLGGADLGGADLGGANLRSANLGGADLRSADLRSANLGGANLAIFKTDFFDILLRAPNEVPGLRDALVGGRVDGSTYEGECACLVGTIAKVRHTGYKELGNGITPNSSRPAEQWFMSISKGDTPETSQTSKITVEWVDEFLGLLASVRATA